MYWDKNPLNDKIKYFMRKIDEEYITRFPENAFNSNIEMLMRLYEEKANPEMLLVLLKYNGFVYDQCK